MCSDAVWRSWTGVTREIECDALFAGGCPRVGMGAQMLVQMRIVASASDPFAGEAMLWLSQIKPAFAGTAERTSWPGGKQLCAAE